MTAVAQPRCTHDHRNRTNKCGNVVDLPCGCQDIYYADGTVCFEHAHAECDGTTEEAR